MDTVAIVLLVLGVIIIVLAVRGKYLWNNWAKPLWNNWAKPLWSWMKENERLHIYLTISAFSTIILVGINMILGPVYTIISLTLFICFVVPGYVYINYRYPVYRRGIEVIMIEEEQELRDPDPPIKREKDK